MTAQEIHDKLKNKFSDDIIELNDAVLQPFIKVDPGKIDEIAEYLRDDSEFEFDYLSNLSGVDLGENVGVVYHLYSMKHNHKIVLKVEAPKDKADVKTVSMLWKTADWHEREAYDLLGINFVNHPDLRRILLPEDWEGYPLRKDYVTPEFYNGLRVPYPQEQGDLYDEE